MSTYATQTSEKKQQPAPHNASRRQVAGQPTAQLVDNRPAAIAQRKLQEAIVSSPRMQQQPLQQERLDNSSRMRQLKAQQPALGRAHASTTPGLVQRTAGKAIPIAEPIKKRPNRTGLPDTLKAGVEHLSGLSLDDVKVHYNSAAPAQLQAHAYAQGTDIHLGPGQEKHLPHEAWHVVQQKQGRVRPTRQLKGETAINDNATLEREADVMGKVALGPTATIKATTQLAVKSDLLVAQLSGLPGSDWEGKTKEADEEKQKPRTQREKPAREPKLSKKEMTIIAAKAAREEKANDYLPLIGHMAGDCPSIKSAVKPTGGHLLTSMQKKWATQLNIESGTPANIPWDLKWSLSSKSDDKVKTQPKDSTMFPAAWTEEDLINKLKTASVVGRNLRLKNGTEEIEIQKEGNTFYPIKRKS